MNTHVLICERDRDRPCQRDCLVQCPWEGRGQAGVQGQLCSQDTPYGVSRPFTAPKQQALREPGWGTQTSPGCPVL